MITFNKTYLQISTEEITPRKIDTVVITFNSPIKGLLFTSIDGYETSIIEDEYGEEQSILTLIQKNLIQETFNLVDFDTKDLLAELHFYYKTELEKLNPEINFKIILD